MTPWLGALVAVIAAAGVAAPAARAASISPYDHIFLIMEENHEYSQIIGNANAPNLNQFASTYGLATNYDAVTHPSAPNYVALVGGSFFGIRDDNSWRTHELDDPDLTTQVEGAGLTWKGYFQSLPKAGFKGTCAPSAGTCYYASKHNGPIYFDPVNGSGAELKRETPIEQLTTDLAGKPPNFAVIVPDICHDMHGGTGSCAHSSDAQLVAAADTYAAGLVGEITAAGFWAKGNNAIVITWDEGSTNKGGGGHVPSIVITSKGPRALEDGGAYSHYGLLATIEAAFGLGCLQNSCSAATMGPLFAHP